MKKQDSKDIKGSEARFRGYALRLGNGLGHKDREGPMKLPISATAGISARPRLQSSDTQGLSRAMDGRCGEPTR